MKILKSYLNGAVVLAWQSGAVYLNVNGNVGGGKAVGIVSGQASIKIGVVASVENLGEAELNALIASHAPTILPVVQMIEGFANSGLAALG
jgi:hypothetical protein